MIVKGANGYLVWWIYFVMLLGIIMNREKALKMLDEAPSGDKPSRCNPSLTQKQGVEIIRKAVLTLDPDKPLNSIFEKRVWQMYKNQKRPKYKGA